jgi:hypothetical protein
MHPIRLVLLAQKMSKENIMKTTSRRNFGKQLAATVAALPVVTLAASENTSAQTEQQLKARAMQEKVRTSHNTPPDVVISDGSLSIESSDELEHVGGNVYKPKVNPTAQPEITHIRVFVDNGDKVYEDLEAEGSSINIGWENNGGSKKGDLTIKKDVDKFTISSDKKLKDSKVNGHRRPNKLEHPGGEDGKEFRIAFVGVTNPLGFTTLFRPSVTRFEAAEFRVLIWRH